MKTRNILISASVALLSVSLSSCHIYNKFDMPSDNELLQNYNNSKQEELAATQLGNLKWQQVFTDPILAGYIERALEVNKDLRNAKLNIDVAHANMLGARLSYLPSVALSASRTGNKYGEADFAWSYNIPLAVSWEIDVFGKILNSKRGAEATFQQTKDYEQAVRSQIIGAVANCYYSIATLKAQLELNRETAEKWAQTVQIMKDLKLGSRNVNEAGVVQSEAQYYSVLASITELETSLASANNTFSLLLNTEPQDWSTSDDAILGLSPEVEAEGVPMSQLAARPDIRAAERAVAVAYYATNSARAAFYPSINITATGGFTNPSMWFVNLAGQLTAPLFSRGQNIARLKATKAQQEQSMNNFQYSLLSAMGEVEHALLTYRKTGEKEQLLTRQVEKLQKSVEYTQELLTLGTSTYLEVLTAQQNLLGAQMGQLGCRLTSAQAVINLYQALGGGRE